VAIEPALVRDFDARENQLAALAQRMKIETLSNPNRHQSVL